jgi:subfamily B ATP-binding cassette protein MsbA
MESQISNRPDARDLPEFKQEIVFDHVCFSYDGKTPVLTDISFTVPRGKVVALVGPSGAGKSTLVSLIPRFHDPTSGRISIDGYDLRSLTLDSLRAKIGLVPQETLLFSDTLRVNISCGSDAYPWERIEAAAKDAQVDGFARELPDGYDTVIGERGCTLSGGQAQRVAIARALLKDPPILILDEATSSLDSGSELLIRQALDRLMENRTVFVIAHRLSTILHADMILVLDNGRIMDIGKHSELLQRCPLYQRLYELQFASAMAVENFGPT